MQHDAAVKRMAVRPRGSHLDSTWPALTIRSSIWENVCAPGTRLEDYGSSHSANPLPPTCAKCPSSKAHHSPFRVAREFVTEDGDAIDLSTAVEMRLQLFCSPAVIHLERSGGDRGNGHASAFAKGGGVQLHEPALPLPGWCLSLALPCVLAVAECQFIYPEEFMLDFGKGWFSASSPPLATSPSLPGCCPCSHSLGLWTAFCQPP